MLKRLREKIQTILVTLRVSILSIFITLFVIALFLIVGLSYFNFYQAIESVSFKFMRQISKTAFYEIVDEIEDVSLQAEYSGNLIQHGILDASKRDIMIHYTYDLMRLQSKTSPSVQSAFWGDAKGMFILSTKLEDGTIATDIVDQTKGSRSREIIFRDIEGNVKSNKTIFGLDYDPRQRPWYQQAAAATKLAWTDVYRYQTGYLGITAADPVFDKNAKFIGVFALNIRLDYLRRFIEKLQVSNRGVVYLISESGDVIAFPYLPQYEDIRLKKINELNLPWLQKSFELYHQNHRGEFTYTFNGEKYLATYLAIPPFTPHRWIVGVVAPQKDFIAELLDANLLILILGLIILLVGIVLMSMLVDRVVISLKKLVSETERIKKFDLHETPPIRSQIKEVFYLAGAISSMKKGLRAFQRYVPPDVVRNAIQQDQEADVGGEKKSLAIFFSDIENFTIMAEHTDPNQLMHQMCEYLNELTRIIIQNEGTIDKFIGDSVMAFWGAPDPVTHECEKAGRAALQCQKRLKSLSLFKTRIALHFGEAIVGNLGSADRLNYTILGDNVNVTSRLEAVNKHYGTHILISEEFYQRIKGKFIVRKVDRVIVKGKKSPMTIYELLAETADEIAFDLKRYQDYFDQAFEAYSKQQWDTALPLFNECLKVYPEDRVAQVFISRIDYFKKHPPEDRWNGVWWLTEK